MTALSPARRAALEAVRDGRVEFHRRMQWAGQAWKVDGHVVSPLDLRALLDAGLIAIDDDHESRLSNSWLTPAGEKALTGEEEK